MEQMRVEGIEEAERVLNEIIRDYPKQTIASGLRAAAKPFVEQTKNAGPTPKFSKLAGVKVYTKGKEPLMAAGQFGGRNKRVWKTLGSYMSMYYASYWKNHGTLANRSKTHKFKQNRKSVSSSWKGGIKGTDSVQKAWDASKSQVINAIPVEMIKASERFIKRMRAKGFIK